MAVNLIDNEEIHVNQDGSDITLEIQADALKNDNVVVGSIRTKNMFNESVVSTVKTFNSSGDIIPLTEGFVQEIYIPVKSSTEYTLSTNGDYTGTTNYRLIFCEYNASKGFIQRDIALSGTSYTITTTANTKYIRIGGNTVFIDALQLEEGDTATAYSPYQNLNLEIKSKYVSGTPDSNGFISTGLDVNNIIIGVAGISPNAGFFTPFIEKNANRLTIQCKTWDQNPITTSVSFTVYYIEI